MVQRPINVITPEIRAKMDNGNEPEIFSRRISIVKGSIRREERLLVVGANFLYLFEGVE